MTFKIAFDHEIFCRQKYGGISRYISNLSASLKNLPETRSKIFAPFHINRSLSDDLITEKFGYYIPHFPKKTSKVFFFLNHIIAKNEIQKFRPSILHHTYYSNKNIKLPQCPSVLTVYDMIFEKFPNQILNAQYASIEKKTAINNADHIICISENTRRDLLEFFKIPEEKISVTYLAADETFCKQNYLIQKIERPMPPYILFVGNRDGYKNFYGLLQAFKNSPRLRNNISIVCFGGPSFSTEELLKIKSCEISENKIFHVSGNDEKLLAYYRSAEAFIYPSIYEGFGIPPLESMAASCPVICSNTSSIPEVVGDAAEMFNPSQVDDITNSIERVVFSSDLRRYLIAKGNARYKKFSWRLCAEETFNVYNGIS